MTNLHQKLMWIGIPLAIVFVANIAVGKFGSSRETWYTKALHQKEYVSAHYVLIGSSRVAAAVDAAEFPVERPALNLGEGPSTTAIHLLGLRRIVEQDPDALRGKLVLIEAAGGQPEHTLYDGGMWIHPDAPAQIARVLRPSELGLVWKSDASSENRWQNTIRLVADKLPLIRNKEMFHAIFTNKGQNIVKQLTWHGEEAVAGALSDKGGIKTDASAQAFAARFAGEFLKQEAAKEKVYDDWDSTCVFQIVQLVRRSGGSVQFFETPLHSQFRAYYSRPVEAESRKNFEHAAQKWGTPIVRPAIRFEDSSFPDVWHLGTADAKLYTKSLLDALEGDSRFKIHLP